jgi:hypothetical protein
LFSDVRFDEVDGNLLYVYARDDEDYLVADFHSSINGITPSEAQKYRLWRSG